MLCAMCYALCGMRYVLCDMFYVIGAMCECYCYCYCHVVVVCHRHCHCHCHIPSPIAHRPSSLPFVIVSAIASAIAMYFAIAMFYGFVVIVFF